MTSFFDQVYRYQLKSLVL